MKPLIRPWDESFNRKCDGRRAQELTSSVFDVFDAACHVDNLTVVMASTKRLCRRTKTASLAFFYRGLRHEGLTLRVNKPFCPTRQPLVFGREQGLHLTNKNAVPAADRQRAQMPGGGGGGGGTKKVVVSFGSFFDCSQT